MALQKAILGIKDDDIVDLINAPDEEEDYADGSFGTTTHKDAIKVSKVILGKIDEEIAKLREEINQIQPGAADKIVPRQPPVQPADRKSTRLNSSHVSESRMPSSA